jgi:hypothetical protein
MSDEINGTGVSMGQRPKGGAHDGHAPDIRALEVMLDYAIIEGAGLKLPLFVLLLRTARLELMTSIGDLGSSCERRHKAKIKNRLSAAECRSSAEPVLQRWIQACGESLEAFPLATQDR